MLVFEAVPFYHHHPSPSLPPPPPFSLENEHVCSFSRLVALYHHPSPSKTSAYACFRGQLFFVTTTTLLPRKRAYALVFETSCSLSPPPSSLVALYFLPRKQARTFVFEGSCSLPAPPPSKTSIRARFRDWLLFATTPSKMSTYTHFRGVYNIINNIFFYFIWFRASGSDIIPFVHICYE